MNKFAQEIALKMDEHVHYYKVFYLSLIDLMPNRVYNLVDASPGLDFTTYEEAEKWIRTEGPKNTQFTIIDVFRKL